MGVYKEAYVKSEHRILHKTNVCCVTIRHVFYAFVQPKL